MVLYGGPEPGRHHSVAEARSLSSALDRRQFEPVFVELRADGRWWLQQRLRPVESAERGVEGIGSDRVHGVAKEVLLQPCAGGGRPPALHTVADGQMVSIDVALPTVSEPAASSLIGLFELAGLPYVGTAVLGSALNADTIRQRRLLAQAELPVAPWLELTRQLDGRVTVCGAHPDDAPLGDDPLAACEALGFPLIVQPSPKACGLDGKTVPAAQLLAQILEEGWRHSRRLLVERRPARARWLECAVFGTAQPRVSVPGELGYVSSERAHEDGRRPVPTASSLTAPAALYHAETSTVQLLSLRAFSALCDAGMARVSLWLSTDRELLLHSVDTHPCLAFDQPFMQLFAASGTEPKALLSQLLVEATGRDGSSKL